MTRFRAVRFLRFFLNDPAPPEISPLPLHAALPIPRRTSHAATPAAAAMNSQAPSTAATRGASTSPAAALPKATPALASRTAPARARACGSPSRSEEHTSELQSQSNLVCRLLLEKKK